ncbi:hypothetical protein BDN70DRAFT_620049 [Pholiota conissans]|uniref:Uncharacterized protein n=1 Tax=Pholiota conissans TaxID=109636 RepID=A0A9P5Z518_9AGAR|nr:hypothetical protein BDN70DRAFT_620049 [Pholiota conissans]
MQLFMYVSIQLFVSNSYLGHPTVIDITHHHSSPFEFVLVSPHEPCLPRIRIAPVYVVVLLLPHILSFVVFILNATDRLSLRLSVYRPLRRISIRRFSSVLAYAGPGRALYKYTSKSTIQRQE